MTDQAAILRERIQNFHRANHQKTLAVVSGKGGVGKSNVSVNFSLSLIKKGYSVLLIDMDIGMGNIDILMGTQSNFTIVDYFENKVSFSEMIMVGPKGIHYIAGGSGLSNFVQMGQQKMDRFFYDFTSFLNQYDYVLFDMGAGINNDSLSFILSVDEVIVVTTPEPTSITDAYAAMKFIHIHNQDLPFYLVVNRTITSLDGRETFQKLKNVLKQFLGKDVISLGIIPDDHQVMQAVRKQIPFIIFNEKSTAAKALFELTDRYCKQQFSEPAQKNKTHFVTKLKRFLFER
ncbi:MinD/ParA family protein [Niallia sp. 01092]|uniref:MinD/ParA family protein n=1 Tax=unclassified Niallia TaxID=2837522 RepID=UPI003FCFBEDC